MGGAETVVLNHIQDIGVPPHITKLRAWTTVFNRNKRKRDDIENERVKRQKLEKENKTLKDRVRELERQNEEMKVEHTEALATKQLDIDRLTTEKETIQNEKEKEIQNLKEEA